MRGPKYSAGPLEQLNSRFARFTGADTDHLLHIKHKDLAVTDLAGAGALLDGFKAPLDEVIGDSGFNLYLGQKIHHVFGAAVSSVCPF